jgi:DNA (cytosine-5)-methyltransferase 1
MSGRGRDRKWEAIDLFCGCGGLTLGLHQAGFHVIGAVELNRLAVETYQRNHRGVRVFESDIRRLDPVAVRKELGLKAGQLSLLAGCPPCQGFSRIRTRNKACSVEDSRNDLLFEYVRFVEAFLPEAVILENVPNLESHHCFSLFLEKLEGLGYKGETRILDASDYGVPQRRKRLIFLAGRNGAIPFASPSRKRVTVRDVIAHLPAVGDSGDLLHDSIPAYQPKTLERIRHIPKDGGSRDSLPPELWLPCHKASSGFKDVYGRMAWDEAAPTITGGCFTPSKGRFLHPEDNRAITLREAAVLQGFPEKYFFPSNNRVAVGLMIGNAIPPPLIASQVRSVKKYLTSGDKNRS